MALHFKQMESDGFDSCIENPGGPHLMRSEAMGFLVRRAGIEPARPVRDKGF